MAKTNFPHTAEETLQTDSLRPAQWFGKGYSAYPASPIAFSGPLEMKAKHILRCIGIPAHMKGYPYLKSAILTVMEDVASIHLLTKVVYPSVAKEYGSSASRVERAIRYAIEATWDRDGKDALNAIHGFPIWKTSARPTNSEFIAIIADYLLMHEAKAKESN